MRENCRLKSRQYYFLKLGERELFNSPCGKFNTRGDISSPRFPSLESKRPQLTPRILPSELGT